MTGGRGPRLTLIGAGEPSGRGEARGGSLAAACEVSEGGAGGTRGKGEAEVME